MPESIPFLDGAGHCILRIPGNCITYRGNPQPCRIDAGDNFNQVIQGLAACIAKITTTTTSTSTTSTTSTTTTTLSTSSTTSTSTTSTTSTSTTSTTSTSTSTSTTSTTTLSTSSTTSTTTTSTSTSTTSTTTTSTTTLPSALIYWGAQASSTPPNAAQVQAQLSSSQNPTGDVSVTWVAFNASPQFCWAAVPTAYPKTKWFDTGSNNGNIGGVSDLFTTVGTVTIGITSYTIYMTQFATQFFEGTLLQN